MKKPKQLITLAAIVATCGLLLASCGGGSSGSSATTINGISVPPEPDATLNNATLAGVDSNSNGVRDDVERKIAQASTTAAQFDASIRLAKAYQEVIVNPTPISRENALLLESGIQCSNNGSTDIPASLSSAADKSMESILFNTEDRKDKLHALHAFIGGYDSDEVSCVK